MALSNYESYYMITLFATNTCFSQVYSLNPNHNKVLLLPDTVFAFCGSVVVIILIDGEAVVCVMS